MGDTVYSKKNRDVVCSVRLNWLANMRKCSVMSSSRHVSNYFSWQANLQDIPDKPSPQGSPSAPLLQVQRPLWALHPWVIGQGQEHRDQRHLCRHGLRGAAQSEFLQVEGHSGADAEDGQEEGRSPGEGGEAKEAGRGHPEGAEAQEENGGRQEKDESGGGGRWRCCCIQGGPCPFCGLSRKVCDITQEAWRLWCAARGGWVLKPAWSHVNISFIFQTPVVQISIVIINSSQCHLIVELGQEGEKEEEERCKYVIIVIIFSFYIVLNTSTVCLRCSQEICSATSIVLSSWFIDVHLFSCIYLKNAWWMPLIHRLS